MTLPSINSAREIWILAAGEERPRGPLALSRAGPVQVPAAGARGRQRTLFLLDAEAASQVPPEIGRPAAH